MELGRRPFASFIKTTIYYWLQKRDIPTLGRIESMFFRIYWPLNQTQNVEGRICIIRVGRLTYTRLLKNKKTKDNSGQINHYSIFSSTNGQYKKIFTHYVGTLIRHISAT